MSAAWDIYNALLDTAPDVMTDDIFVGRHWIVVRSGAYCGMSMRYPEGWIDPKTARAYVGKRLRETAALVKSWNFGVAALGLAAINAACNREVNLKRWWDIPCYIQNASVFQTERSHFQGKKVAIIGGFPVMPEEGFCQLSVLERRPQAGQLPDSACEYILPEQDVIFATGTTLINKTLPRLLELKGRSRFYLVGPSVPLHPLMHARGVDELAGVVINDIDSLYTSVRTGSCRQVFKQGALRVQLPREGLRHA